MRGGRIAGLAIALAVAAAAGCAPGKRAPPPGAERHVVTPDLSLRSVIPSRAAQACGTAECHPKQYDAWRGSQHAWANRLLDPARDDAGFAPPQTVKHGSFVTTMHKGGDGAYYYTVQGPDGRYEYHAELACGITPLRQYLVTFPGGRLQVCDMSFDPRSNEWFNAFGAEDRQPHEWGFWKNRSMTWNVQCAFCHMTGLKKNYDPATDEYHTTWDEMGVSCAQCHGPMPQHAARPRAPVVPEEKLSLAQDVHTCASCHARREELSGAFRAGERFEDHYRIALADQPTIYYPDGQIRDEDYEYGSFLMSRMALKGVLCFNCHDAHSGKTVATIEDNRLCLTCHGPPGQLGAKVIDVVPHGGHKPGSVGNRCVECHMPQTTYMARDPRRDHGWICPDPLLTKELGIPNACTRCHKDKTTAWEIEWCDKWYGAKMERRTRQRARAVARAQAVEAAAVPDLLRMAKEEEIDAWRAAMVLLLEPWSSPQEVFGFLRDQLGHSNALVRSSAVRALEARPRVQELLKPLRLDPARLVRIDAAWATLGEADREPRSYADLLTNLAWNCDQPAGALRRSQLALRESRPDEAVAWARKFVAWDPSPQSHYLFGRVLNAVGNNGEALAAFRKAAELDPRNAEFPFTIALLLAELGQPREARTQLERAVKADARYGRAWYNLGLAYAQEERLADAVAALRKAEELMPGSPDAAYARATIHLRQGDRRAAAEAARQALAAQPGHEPSVGLLRELNLAPMREGGL